MRAERRERARELPRAAPAAGRTRGATDSSAFRSPLSGYVTTRKSVLASSNAGPSSFPAPSLLQTSPRARPSRHGGGSRRRVRTRLGRLARPGRRLALPVRRRERARVAFVRAVRSRASRRAGRPRSARGGHGLRAPRPLAPLVRAPALGPIAPRLALRGGSRRARAIRRPAATTARAFALARPPGNALGTRDPRSRVVVAVARRLAEIHRGRGRGRGRGRVARRLHRPRETARTRARPRRRRRGGPPSPPGDGDYLRAKISVPAAPLRVFVVRPRPGRAARRPPPPRPRRRARPLRRRAVARAVRGRPPHRVLRHVSPPRPLRRPVRREETPRGNRHGTRHRVRLRRGGGGGGGGGGKGGG